MKKYTVAIPTYNSSDYLKECIYGFKNSQFLDEIIVSDDCSKLEELEKIRNIIKQASKKLNFEIKLMESSKNNGAFINKYNLILASRNEWVYQIDSDNVPFPKIDNVISNILLNHKDQKFIYYPTKLIQFWKYKRLAKLFSFAQKKYRVLFTKNSDIFNTEKTKQAINEFLNYDSSKDLEGSPSLNSAYLIDKHIFWVLNSGNFIVNRNQFLDAMKSGLEFTRENTAMDAVAFSYLWLKYGGSIYLHSDLSHYHRKRLNSVSYTEKESSVVSRNYLTNKILSL
jgi:glycosyltransferase involved in cell wall biosynthesis